MKTRLAALALLTAFAGAAHAHSGDVLAGVAAGTVIGSAIHSRGPAVSVTYGYGHPYGIYAPPPVVYAPPPPTVVYPAPRPVYGQHYGAPYGGPHGAAYGAPYGNPYGNGWGPRPHRHHHHHHRGWDDRGGRGHGR